MKSTISVAASVFAAALAIVVAVAQAPPPKPTPGPEHKKLGYFVGNWKGVADVKANPWFPGGTYNSTDTCEWFEGGFAVVCRSEGIGPMGSSKGPGIMSYSTDQKVYTYYGLDNRE